MSATSAPTGFHRLTSHPWVTFRHLLHRFALLINESDRRMQRAGVVVAQAERGSLIPAKTKV
ncbi:hypothetical protein [Rhodopirellula sp. SWK7]|uniref:hypothetical protein n=1 Tax=Rhodopirellula sp. SWK7 TaxID=595460 RepID=UPI0002BF7820|nr:hypothetical protein [Rhodopirellula sp. SWK7]EMI42938.1 hypothetical protein RRSWK_04577 [Rhodopirellula sp. SWK7]